MQTGDFEWSQTDQSVVLGSFFYGYVASQLFGGFLTEMYGGKWVMGLGTFIEAILALMSPIALKLNKQCFVILRIVQGLAEVIITSE